MLYRNRSLFSKQLLILASAVFITLPASAQNKISIKHYKAPAVATPAAAEEPLGFGFVSASPSHVRSQARLCDGGVASPMDAVKAYSHLVAGVGANGWTYGTQNCWLFVNVAKSSADVSTGEDFYFFKGIEMLQKDGLLPNPLIEREMPGATELMAQNSKEQAVLAVRLHSLR